jgi:hypothetical protein
VSGLEAAPGGLAGHRAAGGVGQRALCRRAVSEPPQLRDGRVFAAEGDVLAEERVQDPDAAGEVLVTGCLGFGDLAAQDFQASSAWKACPVCGSLTAVLARMTPASVSWYRAV